MRRSAAFGVVVAVASVATASALSGAAGKVSENWLGFGRTPDQNRHSPLTQITKGNVDQLARLYTVNFREIDPDIRRGQQSYPLVVRGVMYVTTNDDNVFALDAVTGKVMWRFRPPNGAIFKNFGIVANRGVAYCDGRLFLTTLDMHIDALSARTGRLLKRVPIAAAVPGAASSYGYSETSAPICAKHTVLIGAAGSEYGVRGFVMAYHTDLTPAWPNPYWTIPPEQQGWRRSGRLVGGGAVWTPVTVDAYSDTVYFGTGSGTPLYVPSLRPGKNPRTDSLIAVDLRTGRQKWWQQLLAHNEWAYDVAQPPLVYTAKVHGKRLRIVSVATMEGVWFAFDAHTGRPLHQRVKVIDRTEHPSLRPGKPVAIYPSSLGGINYSPASYDPATNFILNAASETASVLVQEKLTPAQRSRKLVGDVFLGLQNGNFGEVLRGWHDHGSVSAIDVSTGRRVWKFRTPEPERGGVTTTASGLGLAGGGDGILRAFDVRNGKILWTFATGRPIAAGPTVFGVNGKEYVAVTVGGTPTSSNGGTASELHVFTLGEPKAKSPPAAASAAAERELSLARPTTRAPTGGQASTAGGATSARILAQRELDVRVWSPFSSNEKVVTGRLLLRGAPVAGASIRVDAYTLPRATDVQGHFSYPADVTLARRHVIAVVRADSATMRGKRLSTSQRRSVLGASGGFNVGFRISGARARIQKDGTVLVTGRATLARGAPAPRVVLYTYRLSGQVTDASGKPVAGAVVVTRTLDRDFWTMSAPTDAKGQYKSFFPASDESADNPVPFSVQVAYGKISFGFPVGKSVLFSRLKSAVADWKLPASGTTMELPTPKSFTGAIYEGLLVGVSGRRGVVPPLAARWPDRQGAFSLVLPSSVRGQTLHFWEAHRQFFSRFAARPGGPVDLHSWPSALSLRTPVNLADLHVPSR